MATTTAKTKTLQFNSGPRRVAMLIYPGVTPLDVAGPLEVFSFANTLRKPERSIAFQQPVEGACQISGPVRGTTISLSSGKNAATFVPRAKVGVPTGARAFNCVPASWRSKYAT